MNELIHNNIIKCGFTSVGDGTYLSGTRYKIEYDKISLMFIKYFKDNDLKYLIKGKITESDVTYLNRVIKIDKVLESDRNTKTIN